MKARLVGVSTFIFTGVVLSILWLGLVGWIIALPVAFVAWLFASD